MHDTVWRVRDNEILAALRSFEELLQGSSLRRNKQVSDGSGSPWEPSPDLVRRAVRRATDLENTRCAVGIELLPYRMVGVLVDEHGARLAAEQLVLRSMDIDAVVESATSLATTLLDQQQEQLTPGSSIVGGFQIGGPVDRTSGVVKFYRKADPTTFSRDRDTCWNNHQPLGALLRASNGWAWSVQNDAEAYAEYQRWFGTGRQRSDFAVLLIREGVGGGLVRNGEVVDMPIEIGNITVFPEGGLRCDCGNTGCLETTGGIYGILDTINVRTDRQFLDIAAAANEAEDGEHAEKAREAFRAAGFADAKGISIMVSFAGPKRIVLYAPAILCDESKAAARDFLGQVRNFRSYIHPVYHGCELEIVPVRPYDGAHGAALGALAAHFGIHPDSARADSAGAEPRS